MAGSPVDGAERICRSDGASESRFVSFGSPVARTPNSLATGVDMSNGEFRRTAVDQTKRATPLGSPAGSPAFIGLTASAKTCRCQSPRTAGTATSSPFAWPLLVGWFGVAVSPYCRWEPYFFLKPSIVSRSRSTEGRSKLPLPRYSKRMTPSRSMMKVVGVFDKPK